MEILSIHSVFDRLTFKGLLPYINQFIFFSLCSRDIILLPAHYLGVIAGPAYLYKAAVFLDLCRILPHEGHLQFWDMIFICSWYMSVQKMPFHIAAFDTPEYSAAIDSQNSSSVHDTKPICNVRSEESCNRASSSSAGVPHWRWWKAGVPSCISLACHLLGIICWNCQASFWGKWP